MIAGGAPESAPPSWAGLRAIDRACVLAHVSDLVAAGAMMLQPAEVLTIVCEAAAEHLSLANVVFFKRLAGRSRFLSWSAPGASVARLLAAREQVWSSAARIVDGRPLCSEGVGSGRVASAFVSDEPLGLSAMLYVESLRELDRDDRALVADLLRRMLGIPGRAPA
jgi:hypothetical protein